MKHIQLFFLLCLLGADKDVLFGQTLNFHSGTIKEAMDLGKKENKRVFVDFYTDWCAPCKTMDRDVFTHADVVRYFNKNFINVKLNAEKGEGISFAKKNKVKAYPTFIIFNEDEKPLFRMEGASSAFVFLEKVQKGMDSNRSPEALAKRYAGGERNAALINDYAFSLMEKGKEEEGYEIVNSYFNNLSKKQLNKPENWFLFERYISGSEDTKAHFLIENKKAIAKKVGAQKVNRRISALYNAELLSYLSGYKFRTNTFDEKEYEVFKNQINSIQLPDSFGYPSAFLIIEAYASGDFNKYLEVGNEHFQNLQSFGKFVMLINMGSNLEKANDETKLIAANFLEKQLFEIKDRVSKNIVRKTISNFRNEDSFLAVDFEEGIFKDALEKAEREDKLIFVDAFASWCGPCKIMDQTVFTNDGVGRYLNSRFINFKVDMEKGEGPELQKKYPVSAFPTYLIIDKEGKEIHRIVGSYSPQEFLKLIVNGTKRNKGLTFLNEYYEQGNREPEMIEAFSEAMFHSFQRAKLRQVLNEYFVSLKNEEKLERHNAFLYKYSSGIADEKFQYFIKNSKTLEPLIGEKEFNAIVDYVCVPTLMSQRGNFKNRDFLKTKYPELYQLDLSDGSVTKTLIGLIDVTGEGDIDKQIAYQKENIFRFNEQDRLMILYLLLGVPDNGTAKQKQNLKELLQKVIAENKTDLLTKSLEQFLGNLEAKMSE